MSITQSPRGLQGVTAVNSSICYIDGEQGVLAYRGIDIHELATHSNFEECCYLLWCGRLPNQFELDELKLSLARERKLDPAIVNLLRQAPKQSLPMDVLRTVVSALAFYDPDAKVNDSIANLRKSIRLTSQIAYVIAAYDRIRKGKPVVEPHPKLSHAAKFPLPAHRASPQCNGRASLRHRTHPPRRP
jgi:citrate synthase